MSGTSVRDVPGFPAGEGKARDDRKAADGWLDAEGGTGAAAGGAVAGTD